MQAHAKFDFCVYTYVTRVFVAFCSCVPFKLELVCTVRTKASEIFSPVAHMVGFPGDVHLSIPSYYIQIRYCCF